jgi:hypothetical protein
MWADVQVQPPAKVNDALGPIAAPAGASNNVRRVPIAGELTSSAAKGETDEKDSSIYDFNTYAEGEEGVRLLVQNGFARTDLWLVRGGRAGEKHTLGSDDRIQPQYRHVPFWASISRFVPWNTALTRGSAWKTGPQLLMMHGNSVEAARAHGVLVEHSNASIEECLRFR